MAVIVIYVDGSMYESLYDVNYEVQSDGLLATSTSPKPSSKKFTYSGVNTLLGYSTSSSAVSPDTNFSVGDTGTISSSVTLYSVQQADIDITYKGSSIAAMSESGTKTLETEGKYCEDDIVITYTKPAAPVPSLQTKSATYTPSTSQQTASITADAGYDGLDEVNVTVNAMPSGTAGTPTATKGTVSSNSVSVTPSVTNTTGYITGGTKTGTPVTVSASELVSGTKTITSSGTTDVTNYASASVASGSATTPATSITANPSISVSSGGLITASVSASQSVTPTVSAGYVSSGTAGTVSVSGSNTSQLTTQAAQTIHPSTTDQTIASEKYLTGAQTVKGVLLTNLSADNIKKGVVVKVGDSTDDDCVASVTGTYEGGGGGGSDDLKNFIEQHGTMTSFTNDAVSEVGVGAFAYCYSLTTVSFPSCTSIGNSAFYFCTHLTTVSFPSCTSVGNNAFAYCYSLTAASFPSCTSVGTDAFHSCYRLTTVSFPLCTSIGNSAFTYCSSLTTASFPSCTSIGSSAFSRCYNLLSLYLTGSSIARLLNSNVFSSTPIAGYTTSTGGVYGSIFVPSSLYSSYIASTNWTYFSSRFVSV